MSLIWLIPIVLYMITHTVVISWWASNIDTRLNTYEIIMSEHNTANDDELLRVWSRILTIQTDQRDLLAGLAVNSALLDILQTNINRQYDEVHENNDLLSTYLANPPEAMTSSPNQPPMPVPEN